MVEVNENGRELSGHILPELRDAGIVSKTGQIADDGEMPIWGTAHEYEFTESSKEIKIPLMSIVQDDGVKFYIGCAKLGVVDAVGVVPSFPTSRTNLDFSNYALDRSLNENEWQRPLELLRIKEISKYLDKEQSMFFSAVTLQIPLGTTIEAVRIDETESGCLLRINPRKYLAKNSDGRYIDVDFEGKTDSRPINIIDGQHRVRGSSQSARGQGVYVPIIVAPLGMTIAEAAQIFADVNIQSKDLHPLLELYIRHAKFLPNSKADMDFGSPEEDGIAENQFAARLANHRAYEMVNYLNLEKGSAIFDRVRIMDNESLGGKTKAGIVIDADKWVKLTRSWHLNSEILGSLDQTSANSVVNSYLNAFRRVAEHEGIEGLESWGDEDSRWNPNSQSNRVNKDGQRSRGTAAPPFSTMKQPFKAILSLFPLALDLARNRVMSNGENSDDTPFGEFVPDEDEFVKVLRPLQWIDWAQNEVLKKYYPVNREQTSKDLFIWMSWALTDYHSNNELHPRKEVWNPTTRENELCLPGRGLFSPPNGELIRVDIDFPNPIECWSKLIDEVIKIWSAPVPNTRPKHDITVTYVTKRGRNLIQSNARDQSNGGWNRYDHLVDQKIRDSSMIRIECRVHNSLASDNVVLEFPRPSGDDQGDPAPTSAGPAPPAPPAPPPSDDGDEPPTAPLLAVVQPEPKRKPIRVPPRPNSRFTPMKSELFPRGQGFEFCRLAPGTDCNNPRCVCKSVRGFDQFDL